MKIISQTENTMALKDGGPLGSVVGIAFAAIGAYLGYGSYISPGDSKNLWISLIFIGTGLLVIFMNTTIEVAIEKPGGTISYKQNHLVGSKSVVYNIPDVSRIETRKSWQARSGSGNRGFSGPRQVLVAQSLIIFKNGVEVPLDSQKGSSSIVSIGPAIIGGGQGKESELANQVAQFLGVPFQEIMPPGMGGGINIGGDRVQL